MPVKTTKTSAKPAATVVAKSKPVTKATAKPETKPTAATKSTAKKSKPTATAVAGKGRLEAKPVVKPNKATAVKSPETPLQKAALKPAAKTPAKTSTKPTAKIATPKKSALKPAAAKVPKAAKPVTAIDPIEQIARAIAQTLDTNKAEQIVTIPLAGRSSLADWMVIASGKSARQVGALANYAQRALAEAGVKRVRIEGMPQGDWVVIDSGDVVIHIFRPEVRDYYQLERLWAEDEVEPAQTRTLR